MHIQLSRDGESCFLCFCAFYSLIALCMSSIARGIAHFVRELFVFFFSFCSRISIDFAAVLAGFDSMPVVPADSDTEESGNDEVAEEEVQEEQEAGSEGDSSEVDEEGSDTVEEELAVEKEGVNEYTSTYEKVEGKEEEEDEGYTEQVIKICLSLSHVYGRGG